MRASHKEATRQRWLETLERYKRQADTPGSDAYWASRSSPCGLSTILTGAISPQGGFASAVAGHPITMDGEERKLRLVVEVARCVWGCM
jgi:hypothetical protein